MRVDFLGAFVTLVSGTSIILGLIYSDTIDAGLAALSLIYTLSFTESLLWIVRCNALMEMSFNSAERINEYLEIEQEPEYIIPNNRAPKEVYIYYPLLIVIFVSVAVKWKY